MGISAREAAIRTISSFCLKWSCNWFFPCPLLKPDYGLHKQPEWGLDVMCRINIMDNIMNMMEKYAYNLEEIVEERTQQLVEEKKKTDRLLYRMLPSSVLQYIWSLLSVCIAISKYCSNKNNWHSNCKQSSIVALHVCRKQHGTALLNEYHHIPAFQHLDFWVHRRATFSFDGDCVSFQSNDENFFDPTKCPSTSRASRLVACCFNVRCVSVQNCSRTVEGGQDRQTRELWPVYHLLLRHSRLCHSRRGQFADAGYLIIYRYCFGLFKD